jgi:hypothetical protein
MENTGEYTVLQEMVCRTKIRDFDHLKQRLMEEWNSFDQKIIDAAVKQWRPKLRACVRSAGGHFENKLLRYLKNTFIKKKFKQKNNNVNFKNCE